jgi:hypothetical protein
VQAASIDSLDAQRADTLQRRLAFERALEGPDLRGERYALLVATRTERAQAEEIARELAGLAPALRVVEWSWRGQPRFDVYAAGFDGVGAAGRVAAELRKRGYRAGFAVSQR